MITIFGLCLVLMLLVEMKRHSTNTICNSMNNSPAQGVRILGGNDNERL